MYVFWVRPDPQLAQYEVTQLHQEILKWGATQVPTGSATGDLVYESRVRPSTFLNRKMKERVISIWGYLSKSQLTKPNRKPIKKPEGERKFEDFSRLKERGKKSL
ncbi:MAG: hypothetical protein KatS3mg101_0169 [Patescibacteria group bacterium]|nr:MAG: hypothetical protein KatS3mg101_0169 [Patescibacteria group bacterium]